MQVDMSGVGEMKARFLEKLESMQKPINSFYIPSIEKYEALIKEVEEAKQVAKKTTLQYRRLKRYDVLLVGGIKKLILPLSAQVTEVKYFVPNEELFEVLDNAHKECGHAGRDIMIKALSNKLLIQISVFFLSQTVLLTRT